MKNITPILASATFVIFSQSAFAATDIKTIDIEVIQGTYAELTGSAVDGNISNINMNSITANTATSLGTLGVNSNGSNCSLAFTTLNNYTLKHESSGAQLKKYRIKYLGSNIGSNGDADANVVLDSCVMPASALSFLSYGATPETIEAGTYKDSVTITLTAE